MYIADKIELYSGIYSSQGFHWGRHAKGNASRAMQTNLPWLSHLEGKTPGFIHLVCTFRYLTVTLGCGCPLKLKVGFVFGMWLHLIQLNKKTHCLCLHRGEHRRQDLPQPFPLVPHLLKECSWTIGTFECHL